MDVKELENEYIKCFILSKEPMDEKYARAFLEYNETNLNAPYREKRIKTLTNYLKQKERARKAENDQKNTWMKLALEDQEIKKTWESLGAYFETRDIMTKWFYKGNCFYTWYSGALVKDEIHRVREANQRLLELINAAR